MPPACTHWRDCGVSGGGCCAIGAYQRPSFGVCRQCPKWDGPSRGLGDTVAKLTEAVGIKPCGRPCAERRAALNTLVPYREPAD